MEWCGDVGSNCDPFWNLVAWIFTFYALWNVFAFAAAGALVPNPQKVSMVFECKDCWIGLYYDEKNQCSYWLPVPFFGLKVSYIGK